jgi:hypothetical protein
MCHTPVPAPTGPSGESLHSDRQQPDHFRRIVAAVHLDERGEIVGVEHAVRYSKEHKQATGQLQPGHPSLCHQVIDELFVDTTCRRPRHRSFHHRVSIDLGTTYYFRHQVHSRDQGLHRSFYRPGYWKIPPCPASG